MKPMLRREYFLSENAYGRWIKTNKQRYLEIEAPDHYTLGRIEGKMLTRQIWLMQLLIYLMLIPFLFLKGVTYFTLKRIAIEHEKSVPKKYAKHYQLCKDEMKGMADSIVGITYHHILIQNTFIEIMYGYLKPLCRKFPSQLELGCTSVGVINEIDRTDPEASERVVIGQNFDFSKFFVPMSSFVCHKVPGMPRIFCFRMGAMLALPAGKSEYGVMLNVNIIKSKIKGKPIIATGIRTRIGWYTCKSAERIKDMILTTPESICYNLLIADQNDLFAMEINPYWIPTVKVENWAARTNRFVTPSLNRYLHHKNYSKKRQRHLEKLMESEYDGHISELDLLNNILSDKPLISRPKTTAFVTNHRFGLGNPKPKKYGIIPDL